MGKWKEYVSYVKINVFLGIKSRNIKVSAASFRYNLFYDIRKIKQILPESATNRGITDTLEKQLRRTFIDRGSVWKNI
ncbi:hypothetical protein EV212_10895 [Frisingicoccus caecimuris]|uniref:Uncharacterized protein n=1 Tax=Frisingicoccus caecimuris TaxID=1796636 RepID=A0A4R2LBI3_9FIRM|nr:hypothetical protein EV212_10895 [Frisingicoccus caecimuris]